jgi:hypothetical protein
MACESLAGADTFSEVRVVGLYQYIYVLLSPKDDVSNVPYAMSSKTLAEVLETLLVPALFTEVTLLEGEFPEVGL